MKGITVQLVNKIPTGTEDEFGSPLFTEELIEVKDVLVGQPTSDDVVQSNALYGKTIAYVLGIPKTDTNDWVNKDVIVFGERFRTVGFPTTGIQSNIPLRWKANIRVERYV